MNKMMMTLFIKRVLPLCLALFSIFAVAMHPASARAEEKVKADTVLIFDASRSMWGQIEGIHRYQMAHGVISTHLRNRLAERNLGLLAFGHRTSSNCGDIETLLGPREFDTEGFISALGRVKPKGKTPISTSLEAAVNEFDPSSKNKNIILLTDGLDNCKADPCATAAQLKSQNPQLKIHTIAFAVAEELHSNLQCVSAETGGKFFHAATEIELSIAFKDAMAAAESQHVKKVAAKPKPKETTSGDKSRTASLRIPDPRAGWDHVAIKGIDPSLRLVRAKSANGKSGMKLSARMAEHTPVINKDINWTIFEYDVVRQKIGDKLASKKEATPALTLESGYYVVRLNYDHITASNVINVNSSEITNANFVLNGGGLTIKAQLANLNAPQGKSAKQWIYGKLKDAKGKPQAYAKVSTAKRTIRLNAGTYKLVSQFGGANSVVETEVTIKPGFLTEVEINHKAGIISFKLSEGKSGKLNWKIYGPDNQPITATQSDTSTYILAPGTYVAETVFDGKMYRARFSVEIGQSKEILVSGS